MITAELNARRSFRLADYPIPEPGPGEVQARVHAVGICGSDLHNYTEGSVGDTPCAYPAVLGHEPAGVITKTGAGVSGWSPGDRVALEPAIYCYHCEFCMTGHHNVCAGIRFMSAAPDPGYFREYVTVPAANLLPLPSNLSFAEATVFEPLAVALHSLTFAQLAPMETAAVFGAGPIGLLTVAMLRLSGAGRVYAIDPVEARRGLALQMGADAAIDPAAVEPDGGEP
jgi:L-iditol 2-dehydrogenase